jgi:hypothetical protein
MPEIHVPPDKSSGAFIKALRQLDMEWKAQLPEDAQIAFYVPLVGGGMLRVGYVSETGADLLYIQGRDEDGETYVLIAHQATIQFFCNVLKVTPEEPRRPIGFGPHPPEPPKPK